MVAGSEASVFFVCVFDYAAAAAAAGGRRRARPFSFCARAPGWLMMMIPGFCRAACLWCCAHTYAHSTMTSPRQADELVDTRFVPVYAFPSFVLFGAGSSCSKKRRTCARRRRSGCFSSNKQSDSAAPNTARISSSSTPHIRRGALGSRKERNTHTHTSQHTRQSAAIDGLRPRRSPHSPMAALSSPKLTDRIDPSGY